MELCVLHLINTIKRVVIAVNDGLDFWHRDTHLPTTARRSNKSTTIVLETVGSFACNVMIWSCSAPVSWYKKMLRLLLLLLHNPKDCDYVVVVDFAFVRCSVEHSHLFCCGVFFLSFHLSIVQVVSIASSRSLSGFVYVGAEIQSAGKWAERGLLIVKSVQKQGSSIALSVHVLVDLTIVYGIVVKVKRK